MAEHFHAAKSLTVRLLGVVYFFAFLGAYYQNTALIGKDGRVKDRWTQPFDPGEMTALIDTMPMRQDEMRRSGTD